MDISDKIYSLANFRQGTHLSLRERLERDCSVRHKLYNCHCKCFARGFKFNPALESIKGSKIVYLLPRTFMWSFQKVLGIVTSWWNLQSDDCYQYKIKFGSRDSSGLRVKMSICYNGGAWPWQRDILWWSCTTHQRECVTTFWWPYCNYNDPQRQ